jgi:tripartite-type tricarboxylate transporter receptor subunit TctC
VEDFTPIAMLAFVTNTLVIHPSVPANNLKEFIAYAKANPGKVAYASAGPGSTNHLSAALLEKMAGIQMLHVPYKGGAPAILDTVAGQTQMFVTAGTQSLPHVKAGKLKLLAVTERQRSTLLKDTPTVAEVIPATRWRSGTGRSPRAAFRPELTARLNKEINAIMVLPDVREKMEAIGVEAVNVTPEQFAATMRADADKWGRLVKELNIKPE